MCNNNERQKWKQVVGKINPKLINTHDDDAYTHTHTRNGKMTRRKQKTKIKTKEKKIIRITYNKLKNNESNKKKRRY